MSLKTGMTEFASSSPIDRNLEERLGRRRVAEIAGNNGYPGANPFLLYGHEIMKPLLRLALQGAGLYQRGLSNALNLQVRRHRLSFPGLPEALNGFRLLHLSDLHIDGMDGLAEVLCRHLSDLPVDLCVITGDYRFDVKGPCDLIYPRMRAVLNAIRSRLGTVGILGNHDSSDIAVELERLGARMLINESVEIERGLWITGGDEVDETELRKTLKSVPRGAFHVALVHTPEFYAEAAAAGAALYLCGHTHAGQVCLPGGRAAILNVSCREYGRGLWKHGEIVGYTSAGTGCCMLPIRYNCPPEIALFELTRA
jgi:predicted MPP superfamily phosphohydrolase